ncbi:MAG: hypothetical protein ACLFST_15745 [Spirochaetia bacterium]
MLFHEALMAFLVVMGFISIPITAIITRKNSPIGQAIAERIRNKTKTIENKDTEEKIRRLEGALQDQQMSMESMEREMRFLSKLLEDKSPQR